MTEDDASLPTASTSRFGPDDVASIIYTSGTTGRPKGVRLTHANFTSLVAALAPVFPLTRGDVVLSVLPLHHTFEFTCGLLLPLSRGARVVYVGDVTGDRVAEGLRVSRATAMVGVPALWQLLERRILNEVDARGPLARAAFDVAGEVNRWLASQPWGSMRVGSSSVPFTIKMGGQIRWLISGGAALPKLDHRAVPGPRAFHSPRVAGPRRPLRSLTVSRPRQARWTRPRAIGPPVPGVQLRIENPDDQGIGEVVCRGPSVMMGYTDDEATRDVIDAEGWLHTGDLGRIDRKGRLEIVGRLIKETSVITPTGENGLSSTTWRAPRPDRAARRASPISRRADTRRRAPRLPRGAGRAARTARLRNDLARSALRTAIDELPARPSPLGGAPVRGAAAADGHPQQDRAGRGPGDLDEARCGDDGRGRGAPGDATLVRAAIATAAGVELGLVQPHATLDGDLGFDSLMRTELLEALEVRFGAVDPQRPASLRDGG